MASDNYDYAIELADAAADGDVAFGPPLELLLRAQVYATVALVDAVNRLTDSYNGWKDLGS